MNTALGLSLLQSGFVLKCAVSTGDKLYIKNLQLGSAGLETNQVYRDENGFLKIVT